MTKYKLTYDETRIIVMSLIELKNQFIKEGAVEQTKTFVRCRSGDQADRILKRKHRLQGNCQLPLDTYGINPSCQKTLVFSDKYGKMNSQVSPYDYYSE